MKLSVLVTTYNHEKYILQAINSILAQEVDFDYEIIIGEDGSTDRTREIVLNFQAKYPKNIRLILPETNLGFYGNIIFIQMLKEVRGQYIAVVDGDDYWTDPQKLKKQVDYLDSHPECVICFHDAQVIYEDQSRSPHGYNTIKPKATSTIDDLLIRNYMPTSSIMFRSGLMNDYPNWLYTTEQQDWGLNVIHAQYGSLAYIDEIMGVYRLHPGSTWSGVTPTKYLPSSIKLLETLNEYLDFRYDRTVRASVSLRYYQLARDYAKKGNLSMARRYWNQGFAKKPINRSVKQSLIIELLIQSYTPPLHKVISTCLYLIKKGIRQAY